MPFLCNLSRGVTQTAEPGGAKLTQVIPDLRLICLVDGISYACGDYQRGCTSTRRKNLAPDDIFIRKCILAYDCGRFEKAGAGGLTD